MHLPRILVVLALSLIGCSGTDETARVVAHEAALAEGAFSFTARTQLTNFGSGANHFPADFTRDPGYFMNRTGRDLVVKNVHVSLDASPYALGAADVDICVEIIPPSGGGHGTRTGVEQFCIAQHKSDATSAWPEPSIDLALPGQGLLLGPDHHVVCTAQGAVAGAVGARTMFSDFACTLDLALADADDPLPPVQSIRAPYFDERFRAEVSSFTPHVNPTQSERSVVGMMSYIAVNATRIVRCIDSQSLGSPWGYHCTDVDRSGTEWSDSSITPLSFRFGPDEQVTAHCQIANPTQSFANICAFYFFVSIPRAGGRFFPLGINDTIPAGNAGGFCRHAYATEYGFTDPEIEANRDLCAATLGGY